MKKQKKVLIIALFSTLILIGVVYATFTAITLKINTTATASASIFNVGFDDVAPIIVGANNITVNATTPEEGSKAISISASGFKAPGDTISIYYDIINTGDVDATQVYPEVGPSITSGENWPDNFIPSGSSWTSDDGVYEFNCSMDFSNEDPNYWTPNATQNGYASPILNSGKKGRICVTITLLKRVDVDTTDGCTVKLYAEPGNLTV